MAAITQHSGNMFNSQAEDVVVTVNCVGFMGKGMALECALRYPEVEGLYILLCKKGCRSYWKDVMVECAQASQNELLSSSIENCKLHAIQ